MVAHASLLLRKFESWHLRKEVCNFPIVTVVLLELALSIEDTLCSNDVAPPDSWRYFVAVSGMKQTAYLLN